MNLKRIENKLKHTFSGKSRTNWFLLTVGIVLLIILLKESGGKGDFRIFLDATADLLLGKNIYKINYNEYYHYFYDVLFALLLSPLLLIPPYWATFLWLVLNVYLSYRIWNIVTYYLPINKFISFNKRIFIIGSILMIFALWHKNIHLNQITIFLLYLTLEGCHLIHTKKTMLGSLAIAFGISIKIMPIVLIPYFLYRGNYKAFTYTIIATVTFLFLPAIIIGYDYHIFLLQQRWDLINPLNSEHILDVSERSFHSITSLMSILLVENIGNSYSLAIKRNIVNVDLETLKIAITIARVFFIGLALFFIRALPFKKHKSDLQFFYELSYICLAIPLIFPHQQHYAFFFSFPATSYLIFYGIDKYFNPSVQFKKHHKTLFLTGLFIIFFLLGNHYFLGQFRNYYDHFKTLTYGVFLIIIILLFAKPESLSSNLQGKRSNPQS